MANATARPQRISLDLVVDAYLEEKLLRSATAVTYREAVHRWTEDTGIVFIDAISREDVLAWRKTLLARVRAVTWNKYRRHLRALMNYATNRGWVRSNAFSEVPPAPTGHRLKKTVESDVLAKALALLSGAEAGGGIPNPMWFWAMVVRALYYTGVRRHQLVGLCWGDVHLAHGTWRIRAETSKTQREWIVPLAPKVIDDLRVLRQRSQECLGTFPSPMAQVYNVTLFDPRYKGELMSEPQVTAFFQRLSRKLDGPISSHRLRHTMATQLMAHRDPKSVQEILGHTDLATTLEYDHPDVERLRSLITQLPEP